jgi:hypothetical protein
MRHVVLDSRPRRALLALMLALPSAALRSAELPGLPAITAGEAGVDVAIDGVRAVVGAPGEADARGAVYVSDCVVLPCPVAQRVAPAGLEPRDLFGAAVALAGDTLAIGAPGDREGAVYIFVAVSGTWVQQAKLRAFDGRNGDAFGNALALAGDRIVIGANGADDNRGVVYVYTRSGASWAQEARLQPDGLPEEARFGTAVGLSGLTLAAGAPFAPGEAVDQWGRGAVWVYLRGAGWTLQQRVVAGSPQNGAQFGFSLALEDDRLLVGAPGGDAFRGLAHVFERSAGTWSEAQLLDGPGSQPGDAFGWRVALDGAALLVGAPFAAPAGAACGRLHAFLRDGGSWVPAPLLAGRKPQPRAIGGYALAMRDGRVLVGHPGVDRSGVPLAGAVDWLDPWLQIHFDGYEGPAAACSPTPPG